MQFKQGHELRTKHMLRIGGLMFKTRIVEGGWLRPLAAALVATRYTNYRELKTFDI